MHVCFPVNITKAGNACLMFLVNKVELLFTFEDLGRWINPGIITCNNKRQLMKDNMHAVCLQMTVYALMTFYN